VREQYAFRSLVALDPESNDVKRLPCINTRADRTATQQALYKYKGLDGQRMTTKWSVKIYQVEKVRGLKRRWQDGKLVHYN
jgi:hypothetical protein